MYNRCTNKFDSVHNYDNVMFLVFCVCQGTFLDDLKQITSEQAEFNRKELESLDESQRLVLEGAQSGSYVRLEIKVGHDIFSF